MKVIYPVTYFTFFYPKPSEEFKDSIIGKFEDNQFLPASEKGKFVFIAEDAKRFFTHGHHYTVVGQIIELDKVCFLKISNSHLFNQNQD